MLHAHSLGRGRFVLALVVAALLCLLLAPSAAMAIPPGVISGTVYYGPDGNWDKSGNPVSGIEVGLYPVIAVDGFGNPVFGPLAQSTSTDVNGAYSFTGLQVDPVQYGVGIAAGAFDSYGTDYRGYFYDQGAETTAGATAIGIDPGTAERNDVNLWPSPVGPSISGAVKGSDLTPRLPIAGLVVSCYSFNAAGGFWEEVAWSETDQDGVYRLWDLAETGYSLFRVGYSSPRPDIYGVRWRTEFWDDDSASTGVGAVSLADAPDIEFLGYSGAHDTGYDLTLDKARKIITGSVFLDHTSTKVPNVDVNLYTEAALAGGDEQYVGTWTDSSGDYAVWDDEVPVDDTSTGIEFRRYGYETNWYQDQPDKVLASIITVSRDMVPLTGVNGYTSKLLPSVCGTLTAVSPSGAPVEGCAVVLYEAQPTQPADPVDWTFTDANGYWEFFYEAEKDFKVRFYTASRPDPGLSWLYDPSTNPAPSEYFQSWYPRKKQYSVATTLSAGLNSNVTASDYLDEYVPSVTGFVRAASGAPIAGVVPEAWVDDGSGTYYLFAWGSESTASGAYTIYGLGDATCSIGISEGFQPNGNYYHSSFGTAFAASDGSTVANVVVMALQLQPFISGTVENEKTGSPLADAYVSLWMDAGGGAWEQTEMQQSTDASGGYAFYSQEPLGSYRVEFGADGFASEYHADKPDVDSADDVIVPPTGPTVSVDASLTPLWFNAMRYDGSDFGVSNRYSVAVNIADLMTEGFDYNPDVILACGEDAAIADPLAAGGLSWAYRGAPMLLTPTGPTTPNYVKPYVPRYVIDGIANAVRHVRATHRAEGITLHVVGGTGSIPDARLAEIRRGVQTRLGLSSTDVAKALKVDRISGRNRYENAQIIAQRMKTLRGSEMPSAALVANGSDPTKFWDALAASPISASDGVPLVLVQTGAVPIAATREISALGLSGSQLYIVGPTTSVSSGVSTALHVPAGNRIKGTTTDQYATARAVANWGIDHGHLDTVTCAVTAALPDALGAATYLGIRRGGMLFTYRASASVPSNTTGFLSGRKATLRDVFIFGGTGSVTTSAETKINNALKP